MNVIAVISAVTLQVPEDHPELGRIVKFLEVVKHINIDLENQPKAGSSEGVIYEFNLTGNQFEQWKSWVPYEQIKWSHCRVV